MSFVAQFGGSRIPGISSRRGRQRQVMSAQLTSSARRKRPGRIEIDQQLARCCKRCR